MNEPDTADEVSGFGPVDLYQKREKIITRNVGGKFQKLRYFTGWPLIIGYMGLPWLTYNGKQLVLFDLPARQFDVFGFSFWPQDFWLLGWLLMLSAFALFTITNVVGRLWCGYTCPQTVWTAVFMWIEQFCEGSRHQRIRLESASWSLAKLTKRLSKHTLWLGWSLLTGLSFVGYFTPMQELSLNLATLNFSAMGGWALFWIAFFSIATYVNAGWLREQVCIYMCPYARFQSAMIDNDTLIVSYNEKRGEPRGAIKRSAQSDNNSGDCIDCQLCVQVCPTGIDIRDGLQYQCIGCAHCIDACNQVMEKINAPVDLISYTTLNALDGGKVRMLRPRSIGYAAVCLALGGALVGAIINRAPMDFDIIRDRANLYVQLSDNKVRNDYQLKVMNKTPTTGAFTLTVIEPSWLEITSKNRINMAPRTLVDIPMTLVGTTPAATITEVLLELCTQDRRHCVSESTRFLSGARS